MSRAAKGNEQERSAPKTTTRDFQCSPNSLAPSLGARRKHRPAKLARFNGRSQASESLSAMDAPRCQLMITVMSSTAWKTAGAADPPDAQKLWRLLSGSFNFGRCARKTNARPSPIDFVRRRLVAVVAE